MSLFTPTWASVTTNGGCNATGRLGTETGFYFCDNYTGAAALKSDSVLFGDYFGMASAFSVQQGWYGGLPWQPVGQMAFGSYRTKALPGDIGVVTGSAVSGISTYGTEGFGSAGAYASVGLDDNFSVLSNGTPIGSMVNVDLRYSLDGRAATTTNQINAVSQLRGYVEIRSSFGSVALTEFCVYTQGYNSNGCVGAGVGSREPEYSIEAAGTVALRVGEQYTFRYFLSSQSGANIDLRQYVPGDQYQFAAQGNTYNVSSNSLHTYLTSNANEVSLRFESGHDYTYTTSVPEPSRSLLFVGGLLTLIGCMRYLPASKMARALQ